ncbi:MAG: hypothetical protein ABEN55_17570, partial [Bradymonadaceae bacterium]
MKDVSEAMRDAFDGLSISTVAELVGESTQEIYFMGGADSELKQRMLDLHETLSNQFPGLAKEATEEEPAVDARDYENIPVEKIYEKLQDPPEDFETDQQVFAELLSAALAAD